MSENNPLQKYFRQPAIYIQLPSDGKGYPPGALEMPPNREIPVYPMTAMDEIIMRTPDALFNGTSNVRLFNSCVPNIKDAWAIPSTDLDLLLTSIRIASYGHEMEMSVRCPHCEEEQEYVMDLRTVIDQIKSPDYNKHLTMSDMEIYFRPLTYREVNDSSKKQFENQKLLQVSSGENSDITEEERINAMSLALEAITKLTTDSMVNSIAAIKTAETLVENQDHIREFLENTSSEMFDKIREHMLSIREGTEMKPLTIKCKDCEKEFQTPFTLDQANFFG